MVDLICPFSATLAQNDFACPKAVNIVRRGGSEFACDAPASHQRCATIHAAVKTASLAAMGAEDDLTTLPHSVLVKIQFGTLIGLQQTIDADVSTEQRIDNIDALIGVACDRYPDPDNLPMDAVVQAVEIYKPNRRRRKK